MKKRIKRKIEKQKALSDFYNMDKYCDECGAKMVIKDKEIIINEDFLGDFKIKGFHPVCSANCGEEFFTKSLSEKENKLVEKRIQELLKKNYPMDKYEYITIEEINKIENGCVDERLKRKGLHSPVFYFIYNKNRFYLKKSYDLYKKNNKISGWFDITK